MTSHPNPSASDADSASENQWLEIGLAALKAGDYLTALAHLAAVKEAQPDQPAGLRAQMGLVLAYERHGQPEEAIALCQTLCQNPNPKVRDWASNTLKEFSQRYPHLVPAATTKSEVQSTGFVPFDPGNLPPKGQTPRSRPIRPPQSASATAPAQPNQPTPAPATQSNQATSRQSTAPIKPAASDTQAEASLHSKATSDPTLLQPGSTQIKPPQYPWAWRQAERAKRWQPLSKPNLIPLWLLQLATAIALFWLTRTLAVYAMGFVNDLFVSLPLLEPIQAFYGNPTLPLLLSLGVMLTLSPWLLDGIFKLFYDLYSLPTAKLASHSPETVRLLNSVCRQKKLSLPNLGLLATDAPIALAYGYLPGKARIIVSQGLLERLAEDEIATIYMTQLGHIVYWNSMLMSLVTLVTQIPYLLYWQVATLGDWLEAARTKAERPFVAYCLLPGVYLAAGLSSLSYGLFRLLRWPALWLSRFRTHYSDRFAVDTTGNPNGLTRALLKMAMGIAEDIQQQGYTSHLLESQELLLPLGQRVGLSLGSLLAHTTVESALAWDCTNPHRHWLNLNQPHPLMGERLQTLNNYARDWHLDTELNWESGSHPEQAISSSFWGRLLLQGAPWFGILLGLLMGSFLWLVGGLASLFDVWSLTWLLGDRWILIGCLPIGLGFGTFIRINPFFKEIKLSNSLTEKNLDQLPEQLSNPTALPIDGQPVQLQGKLLGRKGISNWLGQDLILQLETGLLRLHHTAAWGPLGTLYQSTRPVAFRGQSITATGWLRRGATTWIDLESLRTRYGKSSRSSHAMWATLLACSAALWGVYLIFTLAGKSIPSL